MILGGSDKGSSYDELAKGGCRANVRRVIVIGRMAFKIKQALTQVSYTTIQDGGLSMPEIIKTRPSGRSTR